MNKPMVHDTLDSALEYAKEIGQHRKWMQKGTDSYIINRLSAHVICLVAAMQPEASAQPKIPKGCMNSQPVTSEQNIINALALMDARWPGYQTAKEIIRRAATQPAQPTAPSGEWPEVKPEVLEIAKEITDGKVTFAYSAKNMRWWMARELMRLNNALTNYTAPTQPTALREALERLMKAALSVYSEDRAGIPEHSAASFVAMEFYEAMLAAKAALNQQGNQNEWLSLADPYNR